MNFRLFTLAPLLILGGCLSSGTTEHSWSCRPAGHNGCASIAQIERETPSAETERRTGTIFGGRVAPWWEEGAPGSMTRADAPRRETDQTMRIVLAPYLDGQGDYHDRSEVFAVMRKAQWWIAPPVAISSEPESGTPLSPPGDATDGE